MNYKKIIKKLETLQLKKIEKKMAINRKTEVFQQAQDTFKLNMNANILSQLRNKIESYIHYLDLSDLIKKGKFNDKNSFYIDLNMNKYKIKIIIKEDVQG